MTAVEINDPLLTGNCPSENNSSIPRKSRWGTYVGMILALVSSLVFSLSALVVKNLENQHPFTIAFWKFQGAFLPMLPLAILYNLFSRKYKGTYPISNSDMTIMGNREHWKLLLLVLLRSFLSCNALLLYYFSLKHLEIEDAMVISSSTPIMVTILARIFLGEKLSVVTGAAAVMSLIGVVIILRPPHFTGADSFDNNILIGTSLGFGCMVISAISYTVLRSIRKVHFTFVTVIFGLYGILENLILILIFGVNTALIPYHSHEILLVSSLVILTFVGQIALCLAMNNEEAGIVSIVRTFDVIFAFSWKIAVIRVWPDKWSFIGAAIVVISIFLMGLRKWVKDLNFNHRMSNQKTIDVFENIGQ